MTDKNPIETKVLSEPAEDSNDMHRLRDLLFGEQALQTEDRFAALETSVNALRRENRTVRQAIDIESTARIEAVKKQSENITEDLDHSMVELARILVQHVRDEQAARTKQAKMMSDMLAAYQKSQDDVTSQLIKHLQKEQESRAAQFAKLRQTVEADSNSQGKVADELSKILSQFAKMHEDRQQEKQ